MRWLALLPLWAVVNIMALFFAPVLALLYSDRDGLCDNGTTNGVEPRLYSCLSLFQTPDNSLLGDCAWKCMDANHWAWRARIGSWPRLQAYLGRFGWLLRNPAYGFELSALAANIMAGSAPFVRGDVTIKDGVGGKVGYCFVRIGAYWNLMWIKRLYGTRCLYWNFGWNLKTFAEDVGRLSVDTPAQYVCSPRFSTLVE